MGLDPHGDRLFLLHLLEIYGYDTLMVSEQLCCSWGTAAVLSSSSAAPLAPQSVGAHWWVCGTISLTCVFNLLLHLVSVAPLLLSVIRCKKAWCCSRNSWVEATRVFRNIWKQWTAGVKPRREGAQIGKFKWTVHGGQRRKRGGIWWFAWTGLKVWKCTREASFLWTKPCFYFPVRIGLRLPADVAFLVSSAGFKHLLFYLFIFLCFCFFTSVCVGSALCSWAHVLSLSTMSVLTAV